MFDSQTFRNQFITFIDILADCWVVFMIGKYEYFQNISGNTGEINIFSNANCFFVVTI